MNVTPHRTHLSMGTHHHRSVTHRAAKQPSRIHFNNQVINKAQENAAKSVQAA